MGLEVVDGHQRLAGDERDRLRGGEPDEDAADQARAGRGGDAVELGERCNPALRKRPGNQAVDHLHMGARRDFRHHAAIAGMLGDLAQHLVGQDLAPSIEAARHHGGGGLVAGRLDPENTHVAFGVLAS